MAGDQLAEFGADDPVECSLGRHFAKWRDNRQRLDDIAQRAGFDHQDPPGRAKACPDMVDSVVHGRNGYPGGVVDGAYSFSTGWRNGKPSTGMNGCGGWATADSRLA